MAGGVPHSPAAPLDDSSFRALAQSAPDAIVTGDASGRIAYANPAASRLFGRALEELVGASITLLMPDRFRDAHSEGFGRFVETGHGHLVGTTIEVMAERADGAEFPIELSLGSAGTGPERTLTAVIRDLTERRRRERHLRAQLAVTAVLADRDAPGDTARRVIEELTRALAWDIGLLWRVGPDGMLRVRHVFEDDPAVTGSFAEASTAMVLEPGRGLPGSTFAAREPQWLDDLDVAPGFLRRDEAIRAGLRGAICLPLLSGGRAIGIMECFTREHLPIDDALRDLLMTVASQVGEHLQRLEAQRDLDEAQERFRSAFESAPIGVALVDAAGRWLDVNPALTKIVGWSRDELLERTFRDITHPDDREADEALVARVLAGELDTYQLEKRYLRPSGESVWVSLSVSAVRRSGDPHFVAQIQDITAARQAADELRRSNAELEDFAHVAAHDLQTPLRTIAGFADLLMRDHGATLGPEGQEWLGLIRQGAEGSTQLLDNLLHYARAGASSAEPVVVDSDAVLDEVLAALHSEIEATGAEITAEALPRVTADRVQLAQVLQNLLANALKFTPEDRAPRVTVHGDADGRMARITVADDGIGVATEDAVALFEMFARGTDGGRFDGAGVGLAVCAKIVERHGGRIWVDPSPGGGSAFSFTLPPG